MGLRFLCTLLTVVVLESVLLCDAQTQPEDSHICAHNFTVTKSIVVTGKCRRGSNEICRRTKKQYVRELRTSCCEGWIYSNTEKKCVADCSRGCIRGTCIAPEVCFCEAPLILKHNSSCEEPQCNPPCFNANCVDDNKCICTEGFITYNTTHCAAICPDGYVNDADKLECKPKCDKCINGYCTAPNTCSCDSGYVLENATCVPYCNQACKNGKCVAPDTCECSVGYSIDPSDKSLCNPICENPCINATCIEPNKCACLTGYELLNSWACEPKCDLCSNGECVAPNQCKCLDGYFKTDGINCTPVCSETCLNGNCVAPNTCTCNEGYDLDTNDKFQCHPVCMDDCVNATCSSPGTCTCLPGFEEVNGSVCRPFCASCEHGVCVSPDNCQCNDGFNRTDGICKPVCSSPCVNGFCESPEKCACNEGYLRDVTEFFCYKPCIGECDNGKCNMNGVCVCDSGFELFNNSCMLPEDCDTCNGKCPDCRCDDGRPCQLAPEIPAEPAPSTSMAGLQITWVMAGCVGILLVTIVIVIIGYIWRKRKEYGDKPTDNGNSYPSVLYTIPNTLIQNNYEDNRDSITENDDENDTKEEVSLHLLEDENEKIRKREEQ